MSRDRSTLDGDGEIDAGTGSGTIGTLVRYSKLHHMTRLNMTQDITYLRLGAKQLDQAGRRLGSRVGRRPGAGARYRALSQWGIIGTWNGLPCMCEIFD